MENRRVAKSDSSKKSSAARLCLSAKSIKYKYIHNVLIRLISFNKYISITSQLIQDLK